MNLELLIDLHIDGPRQGPGSEEHTNLALNLSGLKERNDRLEIADIGCGTGASTLVLARHLNANITAVDFLPEFLNVLRNANGKGVRTLQASMDDLPFDNSSLDAIWSEGAIYHLGFEKGVDYFSKHLKPGGILAVSEITWLTSERPDDLTAHWESEYNEMATAAEKITVLEQKGFLLKGYFPLPERCWLENYYEPMESRFDSFLSRNDSGEARALVVDEQAEIEIYRKYRDYFSYGFYVAEKVSSP